MRFKGFEGEWEEKKLGDVSIFYNGKAYKQSELLNEGKYPVLRVGNLFTNENWYYSDLELDETKYIDNGDLIYAWSASFRPKIWKGSKVIYHYHIWKVEILKDIIDKSFYYILLENETARMKSSSSNGFALLHITKGTIENWQSYFPPISEQQNIALLFSFINERISTQNKIIAQLQSLMQSLSEQLFKQQIRFRDENGNDFPDWEEKKLGDIGETYNGLAGKTKDDFGKGERYIQYKQIFDSSKIKIVNCGLVDILKNENQNRVQYGDVFFTTSSETPEEIGMSSVLLDDVENIYLNSFCFGFRPNSLELLEPQLSRYFFRSKIFRDEIITLAQGSTRYNLSKGEFKKLSIKLPCLEEQALIANFLSSIDEKTETEKTILKQYEKQKRYFLQNMFM